MDAVVLADFRDHGYAVAPVGQGDIEVAYAIGLEGKLDDERLYDVFGLSPGIDINDSIDRGGIVVVLYNPRDRVTSWRAGLSAPADDDGYDDSERYELIERSVERIFAPLRDRR
ncbi:MAG: hypothetical protein Phyf2KO_00860 [Phycisphaerales bacterium]